MYPLLNYFQLLIAVLLAVSVLLQRRGGGLSPVLGGGGFYRTRRGVERFLFIGTVILAALFIINAVLAIALR